VAAQWRLESGGATPGPSALSLEVRAVVFDDLTWEGEPDAVAVILESRVARVEEIGRVLADLEKQEHRLRSSQEWSVALKQQARALKQQGADSESPSAGRREAAAVLSATRLELAQWLENASRDIALSPDAAAAAGFLTGGLRERYELGLRSTVGEELAADSVGGMKGGER